MRYPFASRFGSRSTFAFLVVSFAISGLTSAARASPDDRGGGAITVSGIVTDPTSAVVSGATVDAVASGRVVATTTTGVDGRYLVTFAADARVPYHVRVRRAGFAEAVLDLRPPDAEAPDASDGSLASSRGGAATAAIVRDVVLKVAGVDDTLIVTASRTPERRDATLGAITIFDAADIAALGSSSLADVVRMAPGLNVESTGREGALASVFSRGGESDYNLVLIDGVRVNLSGGQFDFSRVSGAEIERVEVLRGAQSALYGSDAIGSVIQVFTKRAGTTDPPRIGGSIEGGSFDTWRGDLALLGGARGRADYHAGAAYRGTDGAFADRLPEKDRYDQMALHAGGGAALGGDATIRTGLRYSHARGRSVGPIAYGARDTGTAYRTKDLSWHLDFAQQVASRVHHTASAAWFRYENVTADAALDPPYFVYAVLTGRPGALYPDSPRLVRLLDRATFDAIQSGAQPLASGEFLATTTAGVRDGVFRSETAFRRPAVKYQADVRWLDDQVLSAGYEYERETNPLADFRVDTHAFFVQQQIKLRDRWFAAAGARVQDHSRSGTDVSPKLSLGGYLVPYRPGALSSIKVMANAGKGIKNPVFGELFGGTVDGNPELRPERARTLDAGAELTFASQRWLARATYFDNRYEDQVAFRSTGPGRDGLPDFLNIDGSRARGLELEAALQRSIAGVTASAAYWLVDTKVVSFVSTSEQFQPGQPLLRRPRHAAMLRLSYARGRAQVHLNVRYTGQRHDAAFIGLSAVPSPQFPNGRPVDITVNPAYTRVWIGGDYRIHDDLTLFARVDNLGDATYESALGYPGLPRSVVVGGRFSFGGRR